MLDGWDTQGPAQHVQQPDLGPRRLALRLQRHHRPTRRSASRARPTRSACRSTAASGAIIRPGEVFEVVAHGTTNPWGLDFDDYGEVFITNCVIEHLFHVVPGAHYQRMYGQDFNPQRLRPDRDAAPTTSTGPAATGQDSRERPRQAQRGRRRPRPRRLHDLPRRQLARRVPQQRLHVQHPRQPHQPRPCWSARAPATSPTTARTSCIANDPWFRGLALKYGPDGGVYVTDWSDTGECHETDADNAHRRTAASTRSPTAQPKPVQVDLAKLERRGAGQAPAAQERLVRPHARRLLQERAAAGGDLTQGSPASCVRSSTTHADTTRRLRGLWALNADRRPGRSGADRPARRPRRVDPGLGGPPARRSATFPRRATVNRLVALAQAEIVAARSAEPGLGPPAHSRQGPLAAGRGPGRGADRSHDPMLPLMTWYGIEPLAAIGPGSRRGAGGALQDSRCSATTWPVAP